MLGSSKPCIRSVWVDNARSPACSSRAVRSGASRVRRLHSICNNVSIYAFRRARRHKDTLTQASMRNNALARTRRPRHNSQNVYSTYAYIARAKSRSQSFDLRRTSGRYCPHIYLHMNIAHIFMYTYAILLLYHRCGWRTIARLGDHCTRRHIFLRAAHFQFS